MLSFCEPIGEYSTGLNTKSGCNSPHQQSVSNCPSHFSQTGLKKYEHLLSPFLMGFHTMGKEQNIGGIQLMLRTKIRDMFSLQIHLKC